MNSTLSRTFSNLRYPLSLLVICLHIIHMPVVNMHSLEWVHMDVGSWLYFPIIVLFIKIAELAVPAFFLISGYLLFLDGNLTINGYLRKIKKRFYTLIIPYLLWNIIAFLYIKFTQDVELTFCEIFLKPANFPLWFLRDLIVLIIISPIFYYYNRYLKDIGFIVITLVYIFDLFTIRPLLLDNLSIYFFYLGIYLQSIRKNFCEIKFSYRIIIYLITILLLLYQVYCYGYNNIIIMQRVYLIFITYSCFLIFYSLSKRYNITIYPELSSASFFIFLSHKVGPTYISKKLFFFLPANYYSATFKFFICTIITSLICFGVYKILSKTNIKIIHIIIGKR